LRRGGGGAKEKGRERQERDDKECDQDGNLSHIGHMLETVDTIFTVLFTCELLINLYANLPRDFFRDGW
jgi:hypothetical protein